MNMSRRVIHHIMLEVVQPSQVMAKNGARQLHGSECLSSKKGVGDMNVHDVCFSNLPEILALT